MNETLKGLFEATNIPEDKQAEFGKIFEAAVEAESKKKAEKKEEEMEEKFASKEKELKEKMEDYSVYMKEEYATKIDDYTNFVVEKYLEENKLAVTNGVKAGLFDSLLEKMNTVFAEHNIDLTDEKVDVVAEMEESLSEKEEELAEAKKEVITLRKEINEDVKGKAIDLAVKGLAESEKEKVKTLAEEIEYDDGFSKTLETIVKTVQVDEVAPSERDDDALFVVEKTEKELNEEKTVKPAKKLDFLGGGSHFFG